MEIGLNSFFAIPRWHRTARVVTRLAALTGGACAIVFPEPAYAYLDPGTGSILVQGIVAGVAATFAYMGLYWQRIKDIFNGRRRDDSTQQDDKDKSSGDGSS